MYIKDGFYFPHPHTHRCSVGEERVAFVLTEGDAVCVCVCVCVCVREREGRGSVWL
jgi:hypothetical protein